MKNVLVKNISLEYRDDIAFRIYTIMNGTWDAYYTWFELTARKKRQRRKHQLFDFYTKAKRQGKTNSRLSLQVIPMYENGGIFYPAGGAKRIAIAYALGYKYLKFIPTSKDVIRKHNTDLSDLVLPDDILRSLFVRKQVLKLSMRARFGTYQSVPELAIRQASRQDHVQRLKEYGVFKLIGGKTVLDIGCNMGMLTLECAKTARQVCGIERFEEYVDIGNILKDFYKIKNIDFVGDTFLDHISENKGRYDVILALAVHDWMECEFLTFFKHLYNLLAKHGTVIFESHKGQSLKRLGRQIKIAGFEVSRLSCSAKRRFALRCTKK